MQAGDVIELSIDSLELQGRGVARDPASGMVVFVERGLPGQTVSALVTVAKGRFAEAEVVSVKKDSPNQVAPACPHFGPCGGCTWQDLGYATQLEWKSRLVGETLARLGKETGKDAAAKVVPCLASPKEYGYRNKMEFAFAPGEKGNLHLGLRQRGSHEVIDVTDCKLMGPEVMVILATVRDWTRHSGLPAWDERHRSGCWRFCVIRQADARPGDGTDGDLDIPVQYFVQLITAPHPDAEAAGAELARMLKQQFPAVSAVVHHTRKNPVPLAQGEELRRHDGPLRLPMPLGDLTFHVSADGFFQTNTDGAVLLYNQISAMAALTGTEVVWDLYCGSGGIALWLARQAAAVVGVDASKEAIRDAEKNVVVNQVQLGGASLTFMASNLRRGVGAGPAAPDVAIVDPPRAGMEPAVVDWLRAHLPQRIVAVSCNPATLARDLAKLGDDYTVETVQPVDMFPHTPHVEVAALLVKK